MEKLELSKLELINGGDFDAGMFITGVCGGIGIGTAVGLFAMNPVAGGTVTFLCVGNSIGNALDWW
jgi:hypothetical protein